MATHSSILAWKILWIEEPCDSIMIILSPFHSVCLSYGLNVSSKKSYVEHLALIVALFGHGAS